MEAATPRETAERATQIYQLWRDVRARAFLAGGCTCACALSPITIKDFETALIFHVASLGRLPDFDRIGSLEDLVERIRTSSSDHGKTQVLLNKVHEALLSFSRQCTSFRAAPANE